MSPKSSKSILQPAESIVSELQSIVVRYSSRRTTFFAALLITTGFIAASWVLILAGNRYIETSKKAALATQQLTDERDYVRTLREEAERERSELELDISGRQTTVDQLTAEVETLRTAAKKASPLANFSKLLLDARTNFTSKNYEIAAKDFHEAYLLETKYNLSEAIDGSILNQAAWSYYLAGSSPGTDAFDNFSKAKELFDEGRQKFPNNADLKLHWALFSVATAGFSSEVLTAVNELAAVDPGRAAIFASAPQTKKYRPSVDNPLAAWKKCLRTSSGVTIGSGKASTQCVLGIEGKAPIFRVDSLK